MTAGIDTSVVVRLLTGEPRHLALIALRYLDEAKEAGDRKDTLDALRAFLATSGVEGIGDVPAVLATADLESAKPGFVDRLIHRNYMRAGAEQVVTFERSAARLPGVVVLTA